MINCPNCNHQNPDGALQCEACYTPLPSLASCPNCGATVQADASFCGQCGSDLRPEAANSGGTPAAATDPDMLSQSSPEAVGSVGPSSAAPTQNFLNPDAAAPDLGMPDLVEPEPLIVPTPIGADPEASAEYEAAPAVEPVAEPEVSAEAFITEPEEAAAVEPVAEPIAEPVAEPMAEAKPVPAIPTPIPASVPAVRSSATQLQIVSGRLRQVQTDTVIELPRELSVVRIGKPNDHTPPDIDVSGFPDSEIVSRVHANIRVEGDTYYLEDIGSSNGTYINGLPLPVGNRHRLRSGDRIALGKGDKVSFVFESGS
ncbi:MAG: FHA domain-containing protein [Cyanobacteria bacterium J06560_2]